MHYKILVNQFHKALVFAKKKKSHMLFASRSIIPDWKSKVFFLLQYEKERNGKRELSKE
jgi:hypothetical protein